MSNEHGWSTLVAKCKSLYERYGGGIKIPSHYVPGPVEVFDETDVSPNVFRFMIYSRTPLTRTPITRTTPLTRTESQFPWI